MKQMWSKEQIEKIAKESGLPEIEVGDAGKALIVNEAETGVEWAEVGGGSSDKILVLDFNNNNEAIDVESDVADKITNFYYDLIIAKNYKKSGSQYYGFAFIKSYYVGVKYVSVNDPLNVSAAQDVGKQLKHYFAVLNVTTAGKVQLLPNTDNILAPTAVTLVGSSGTMSANRDYFNSRYVNDVVFWWKNTASDTKQHLINFVEFSTASTGYCVGLIHDYDNGSIVNYKIVLDKSDWSWTVSTL